MNTQKSISISVIQKMIEAGKLGNVAKVEDLLEEAKAFKSSRNWDRKALLEAPLGDEELTILKAVLDTTKGLKQIDDRFGYTQGTASHKAKMTALRVVYQNREKLGF